MKIGEGGKESVIQIYILQLVDLEKIVDLTPHLPQAMVLRRC
jgi:hypothetical protein